MQDFQLRLFELSLMALPFLVAVTVREGIRAYVVDTLGDPTPKREGRLTMNPSAHFDPIMTGLMPLLMYLAGAPFLVGGGKPLPINPANFSDQRRGIILSALAGPFGNFLIAVFFAYVIRFGFYFGAVADGWLLQMAKWGIALNCIFMVLSLVPVPPFDGGRALMYLLPRAGGDLLQRIEPFGFFVFIGIIIIVPKLVTVPAYFMMGLVSWLVGLV